MSLWSRGKTIDCAEFDPQSNLCGLSYSQIGTFICTKDRHIFGTLKYPLAPPLWFQTTLGFSSLLTIICTITLPLGITESALCLIYPCSCLGGQQSEGSTHI